MSILYTTSVMDMGTDQEFGPVSGDFYNPNDEF